MKKIVFACIAALISATAFAATAYMDTVSRQISWTRPDKAVHPETKQEFKNPSDGTLVACGFVIAEYEDCPHTYRVVSWDPPSVRAMTQDERDIADAASAAFAAEAAALSGPPPEVFVPVLDDAGNAIGTARLVVRASQWVLMPLTNSMSPQRYWVEQQAEFTGRSVEMDTKKDRIKAAKSKGNGTPAVLERLSALEAAFGVR